jgi:hypothetical protein
VRYLDRGIIVALREIMKPEARDSDEWAEAIGGDLAERLDSFAFEREKILDKLDIRSAKTARSLAMELRAVRRTLASTPRDLTDLSTREVLSLFRHLRQQADDLLAGKSASTAVTSRPPSSGETIRDFDSDPDEITAARTPESLRSTSGKKR